jgi:hypothetical protein
MNRGKLVFALLFAGLFLGAVHADECMDCHEKETPGIVAQWKESAMADDLSCPTCHGRKHTGYDDAQNAKIPTPDTCEVCHEDKVAEFSAGKHAIAWAAMNAMPTTHMSPDYLIEGKRGCGGCHQIGLKSDEDTQKMVAEGNHYGAASCDACHTRHKFSKEEARKPEACRTCHMGFDHPQWEMWSTSKHGSIYAMDGDNDRAPICQDCHMQGGNHEVRTAWGFLALRTNGLAPYPGEDEEWWADRVTILQAIGVLDQEGNPTTLLDTVAAADVARLSAEDFDAERAKMVEVCKECHSASFVDAQMKNGDAAVRESDKIFATAIREVVSLYEEGLVDSYPSLLSFHNVDTEVEQHLYKMFMEYRMRAFQGAFHANPDYAFWYGNAELVSALAEIKEKAQEMREAKKMADDIAELKGAVGQEATSKEAPAPAEAKGICGPSLLAVLALAPLVGYRLRKRS